MSGTERPRRPTRASSRRTSANSRSPGNTGWRSPGSAHRCHSSSTTGSRWASPGPTRSASTSSGAARATTCPIRASPTAPATWRPRRCRTSRIRASPSPGIRSRPTAARPGPTTRPRSRRPSPARPASSIPSREGAPSTSRAATTTRATTASTPSTAPSSSTTSSSRWTPIPGVSSARQPRHSRERRRHQRRPAGGQVGGGLPRQAPGRRRRVLFPGLSEEPRVRVQRPARPRRSPGRLAEKHLGHRRRRGGARAVRLLARIQAEISRGRRTVPAAGAPGLAVPHKRHRQVRQGRRLPEDHLLRRRLHARRRTRLGGLRDVPGHRRRRVPAAAVRLVPQPRRPRDLPLGLVAHVRELGQRDPQLCVRRPQRPPARSRPRPRLPRRLRGADRRRRRRRARLVGETTPTPRRFPTATKAVHGAGWYFSARPGLRHGGRLPDRPEARLHRRARRAR